MDGPVCGAPGTRGLKRFPDRRETACSPVRGLFGGVDFSQEHRQSFLLRIFPGDDAVFEDHGAAVSARQPEIGVGSLPGAVDRAAHDRDFGDASPETGPLERFDMVPDLSGYCFQMDAGPAASGA